MERDKCCLSLLYSVSEGLNSFFSSVTQENMPDGKKETVSITTFKKWPFANDFGIETEDCKVLPALCKYCSEVEYNDLLEFNTRGKV